MHIQLMCTELEPIRNYNSNSELSRTSAVVDANMKERLLQDMTASNSKSLSSIFSLHGNAKSRSDTSPATKERNHLRSNQPTDLQLSCKIVSLRKCLNEHSVPGEPNRLSTGIGPDLTRSRESYSHLQSTLSIRSSGGDSGITQSFQGSQAAETFIPLSQLSGLQLIPYKQPNVVHAANSQENPGAQLDVRQLDQSSTQNTNGRTPAEIRPNQRKKMHFSHRCFSLPSGTCSDSSDSDSTPQLGAYAQLSKSTRKSRGASAALPTKGFKPQLTALFTAVNVNEEPTVVPMQANPSPEPPPSIAIALPAQSSFWNSTSQSYVLQQRPPEPASAESGATSATRAADTESTPQTVDLLLPLESVVPKIPTTLSPVEDFVHQELLVTGVPEQLWEQEDTESLNIELKLESLLSTREISLRAYNKTISVHRATPLGELRVVRVTGFGPMISDQVRASEGVLRERLTSCKYHGGPLDAVHVSDGEALGSEPLVVVAFKNPKDAQNAALSSQTNAILFIKCIKLRLEPFDHPDFFPSSSTFSLNRTISKTQHPSVTSPNTAAALTDERNPAAALLPPNTLPSGVSTNSAAAAPEDKATAAVWTAAGSSSSSTTAYQRPPSRPFQSNNFYINRINEATKQDVLTQTTTIEKMTTSSTSIGKTSLTSDQRRYQGSSSSSESEGNQFRVDLSRITHNISHLTLLDKSGPLHPALPSRNSSNVPDSSSNTSENRTLKQLRSNGHGNDHPSNPSSSSPRPSPPSSLTLVELLPDIELPNEILNGNYS